MYPWDLQNCEKKEFMDVGPSPDGGSEGDKNQLYLYGNVGTQ